MDHASFQVVIVPPAADGVAADVDSTEAKTVLETGLKEWLVPEARLAAREPENTESEMEQSKQALSLNTGLWVEWYIYLTSTSRSLRLLPNEPNGFALDVLTVRILAESHDKKCDIVDTLSL